MTTRLKELTKNVLSSTIQTGMPMLRKTTEKNKKRNSKSWAKHTAFYQIPRKRPVTITAKIWTISMVECQILIQRKYSSRSSAVGTANNTASATSLANFPSNSAKDVSSKQCTFHFLTPSLLAFIRVVYVSHSSYVLVFIVKLPYHFESSRTIFSFNF